MNFNTELFAVLPHVTVWIHVRYLALILLNLWHKKLKNQLQCVCIGGITISEGRKCVDYSFQICKFVHFISDLKLEICFILVLIFKKHY